MKALKTQWRLWLSVFPVVWTLIGLTYALNYFIYADHYVEIFGGKNKPTLPQMLVWELPYWLLWAATAPLVIWLTQRFRLERGRLFRNSLLHLGACIALALAHRVVYVPVIWALSRLALSVPAYQGSFVTAFSKNFFFNLPNGFLCYVTIVLAGTYYRHYLEEELEIAQLREKRSRAELQALKMQLHPHFLSNSLHSISALMTVDLKGAREMAMRCGDFLRLTLETSGAEVSLRDELEFTSCYLSIEAVRFRDRLKVEREIEPETLDASVPNLILQPLVENAIKHGIMGRLGAGRITIRASRHDDLLRLEVEDDGPGLRADPALAHGHGRGFALTRERLEHLYGTNQHFLLSDAPEDGLRVTLEMPYRVSSATATGLPSQGAEQATST